MSSLRDITLATILKEIPSRSPTSMAGAVFEVFDSVASTRIRINLNTKDSEGNTPTYSASVVLDIPKSSLRKANSMRFYLNNLVTRLSGFLELSPSESPGSGSLPTTKSASCSTETTLDVPLPPVSDHCCEGSRSTCLRLGCRMGTTSPVSTSKTERP